MIRCAIGYFSVVVLLGLGVGSAFAGVSDDVQKAISQAAKAGSVQEAMGKLDDAERLLRSGDGASELERGFAGADIVQARGKAFVAAWRRAKDGDAQKERLAEQGREMLVFSIERYEAMGKMAEALTDKIQESSRSGGVSSRLKEAAGQAERADYSMAWSWYNLGVVGNDHGEFEKAIKIFKSFTRSGQTANPIVADCYWGRGLCLFEMGRYYEVIELFDDDVFESGKIDSGFLKRVTFLKIRAYSKMPSYIAVENAAGYYFDNRSDESRLDGVELQMLISRMKSLVVLADNESVNPYYQAHRRRLIETADMVYGYGKPWSQMVMQVLADSDIATPGGSLVRAGRGFKAEEYKEAFDSAGQGLGVATAKTDAKIRGDLLEIRAVSATRIGEFKEAFDAAGRFAGEFGSDPRGVKMATLGAEAALKAVDAGQMVTADEYGTFLEKAAASTKDAGFRRRVGWYKGAMLLKVGEYEKAFYVFDGADKGAEDYPRSVYAAGLSAYRLSEQLGQDGQWLDKATGKLIEFGQIKQAGGYIIDEQLCVDAGSVAIAVLQVMAESQGTNEEKFSQLIDSARTYGDSDREISGRLDAMRIEILLGKGKIDEAYELGGKLIDEGQSSMAILNALLGICAKLESGYPLPSPGTANDQQLLEGRDSAEKMLRVCEFYLKYSVGSEDQTVKANRRVVGHKLGQSLLWLGRYDEAVEKYEKMLADEKMETSAQVVAEYAMGLGKAGEFDKACGKWQMLCRRLERQSELWYHSNYNFIYCMIKNGDMDQGKKQLEYFKLRYGEAMDQRWQEKFDELGLLNESR